MGLIKDMLRDLSGMPRFYKLAKWFLRFAVFIYMIVYYGPRLMAPELSSEYFLLSLVYLLFSFLLIIGGFNKTSDLTRFSALFLFFAILAHIVASLIIYKSFDELFASRLLLLGVTFFFMTTSKRYERYKAKSKNFSVFDETEPD